MYKKIFIIFSSVLCLNILSLGYADDFEIATDFLDHNTANLSSQEVANTSVALLGQVSMLQQEIADLRGQIEMQQKHLQDLRQDIQKEQQQTKKSGSSFSLFSGANPAKAIVNKTKGTDKQIYQSAYRLAVNHLHEDAISAFRDYLAEFPEGKYRVEAQYWLAEIYLSQWHENLADQALLDNAVTSLKQVAAVTDNPKASQALLKLGLVAAEQGRYEEARKYFTNTKDKYPNSSPARIAIAKLDKLEQQGKL